MGALQLTQLQKRLDDELVSHIDLSDLAGHGPEQQAVASLTRSLPAFALMQLWGVPAEEAAGNVTDGSGDGGLDLIAVDATVPRLFLAQSKWSQSGSGSAAKTDMMAFTQGVQRLLKSDWDYFSPKIQARSEEIEAVIFDPAVRLHLVFTHSGSGDLAPAVRAEVEPLLSDLNEFDPVATFDYLSQSALHRMLIPDAHAGIDLDVELSDWGKHDGPAAAFYGHVSGREVAEWHRTHGDSLFESNLRSTLPSSAVNDLITTTASETPSQFWYFNNGITALCQRVEKAPAGVADRRSGHFSFKGVQVVNGAQTVGSLGRVFTTAAGEDDDPEDDVRVMIRFIQTEGTYEGFASDVTRWNNTQNSVGGRDFLALDPEQTRISREFAIDGRQYVFRSGDTDPGPADGCGVQEATVALACLQPELRLAVQAKREVSVLWADIEKAPYKTLFNPSTNSQQIWRAVSVLRAVEEELKTARSEATGRRRNFLTYLNRVALWIVNQDLQTSKRIEDQADAWSAFLPEVEATAKKLFPVLADTADATYQGYPANLAKNARACTELVAAVQLKLAATQSES